MSALSLPPEVLAIILRYVLFHESETSDFVDIPAISTYFLSELPLCRFQRQVLLTCRQFYEIGSAIFYAINYFRVDGWTIRRGSGLAPQRLNPYHFMKKIWLEDDFAPASGKGKALPGQGIDWTHALLRVVPELDPEILYVGYLFPNRILLEKHDVLCFRVRYNSNLQHYPFVLVHPILGHVAKTYATKEISISSKDFDEAAERGDLTQVHRYLDIARRYVIKQAAVCFFKILSNERTGKPKLARNIYQCITPFGYGLMASKRAAAMIEPPSAADLEFHAAPQPIARLEVDSVTWRVEGVV